MKKRRRYTASFIAALTLFSASLCTTQINYGVLDTFYKLSDNSNQSRATQQAFSTAVQSTANVRSFFMNDQITSSNKTSLSTWQEGNGGNGSSGYYFDQGGYVGSHSHKQFVDFLPQGWDTTLGFGDETGSAKNQFGILMFELPYTLQPGHGFSISFNFSLKQSQKSNATPKGFIEVFTFNDGQTIDSIKQNTTGINLSYNNTASSIGSTGYSAGRYTSTTTSSGSEATFTVNAITRARANLSTTPLQSSLIFGILVGYTNVSAGYSSLITKFKYTTTDKLTNKIGFSATPQVLLGAMSTDGVSAYRMFFQTDASTFKSIVFPTSTNVDTTVKTKSLVYLYSTVNYANESLPLHPNISNLVIGQGVNFTVGELKVQTGGSNPDGNGQMRVKISGQNVNNSVSSTIKANTISFRHNVTFENIILDGVSTIQQTYFDSQEFKIYFKGKTTINNPNGNLTVGSNFQKGVNTPATTSYYFGENNADSVTINVKNFTVKESNTISNTVGDSKTNNVAVYTNYANFTNLNSFTFNGRAALSVVNSTLDIAGSLTINKAERFYNSGNTINATMIDMSSNATTTANFQLDSSTLNLTSTSAPSIKLASQGTLNIINNSSVNFKSNYLIDVDTNKTVNVTNSKLKRDLSTLDTKNNTLNAIFNLNGGKLNINNAQNQEASFFDGDKYTHIYLGDNFKIDDLIVESIDAKSTLSLGFGTKIMPTYDNTRTNLIKVAFHIDDTHKIIVHNEDSDLYSYKVMDSQTKTNPTKDDPETLQISRHTHRYDNITINTDNVKLNYLEGEYFNPNGLVITGSCGNGEDHEVISTNLKSIKYDTRPLEVGRQYITITVNTFGLDIVKEIPITVNYRSLSASIGNTVEVNGTLSTNTGFSKDAKLLLEEVTNQEELDQSYQNLLAQGEKVIVAYNFNKEGTISDQTRYRFTLNSSVLGENMKFANVLQLVDNTYTNLAIIDQGSATSPMVFETNNTGTILIIGTATQSNTQTKPKDPTVIGEITNNFGLLIVLIVVGILFALFVIAVSAFILSRGKKKKHSK